eukprot:scaffold7525_cov248-Pinguiococcus_pyrenoidosus.AAC.9
MAEAALEMGDAEFWRGAPISSLLCVEMAASKAFGMGGGSLGLTGSAGAAAPPPCGLAPLFDSSIGRGTRMMVGALSAAPPLSLCDTTCVPTRGGWRAGMRRGAPGYGVYLM